MPSELDAGAIEVTYYLTAVKVHRKQRATNILKQIILFAFAVLTASVQEKHAYDALFLFLLAFVRFKIAL